MRLDRLVRLGSERSPSPHLWRHAARALSHPGRDRQPLSEDSDAVVCYASANVGVAWKRAVRRSTAQSNPRLSRRSAAAHRLRAGSAAVTARELRWGGMAPDRLRLLSPAWSVVMLGFAMWFAADALETIATVGRDGRMSVFPRMSPRAHADACISYLHAYIRQNGQMVK